MRDWRGLQGGREGETFLLFSLKWARNRADNPIPMQYTARTVVGSVTIADYTSTLPLNTSEVTLTDYRMTHTGPTARINGTWFSVNGAPEHGWLETRYPLTESEQAALR